MGTYVRQGKKWKLAGIIRDSITVLADSLTVKIVATITKLSSFQNKHLFLTSQSTVGEW